MTFPRPIPLFSLPGAGRPQRGLFVGRSATLLAKGLLANGAESSSSETLSTALSPEAMRMLFRAGQRGWSLYLIGNEESVAQGRVSDAAWTRFEADFLARLRQNGVTIVRHYACLDHPNGKGEHRRDSVFRFPNTGALYHAGQEDGIELRESWVIAAEVDELAAGWRAGCRTARVGTARPRERDLEIEPDLSSPDLAGALAEVFACDEYSRT